MKVSASLEDTQLAYSANIRVYPKTKEFKKRVIQELHIRVSLKVVKFEAHARSSGKLFHIRTESGIKEW